MKERVVGEGRLTMGVELAKELRQNTTLPEVLLWQQLRNRRFMGLKFRRQYPIGPYVVDFICLAEKLVIELDGRQHMEQGLYDKKRTDYLEHFSFKVLRFWNHDVLSQLEVVLEQVRLYVKL